MNIKKSIMALLTASLLLLSACGGNSSSSDGGEEQPKNNNPETDSTSSTSPLANTFTYAIGGDPGANVNPITSNDRWGLMTSNLVYSPLFKIKGDEYVWYLATGYELSEDSRTYTFQLREDVVWSDGEPFTADDVIFTLEAVMNPDNACEMYENFVTEEGPAVIEKIDDYAFSVTFPSASPAHMEAFAYQIYIEPKHVFENVLDYYSFQHDGAVVGTGPYILTEYSPGSYLRFDKNENYFQNTSSIDTIVFRIIPSNDSALIAVQSGEVDAWATIPSYLEQIDLDASNLHVESFNQGRVAYLEANCLKLTDIRVRQAIFYALNRDELATAAYLNPEYYDDVYTFLPPNNAYYDPSTAEKYETNLDKAKSLLAEAGVSDLHLTIGYPSSDTAQEIWALLIQQELSQIGISLELYPMESSAYSNTLYETEKPFDLFFGGFIMGSDPQTYAGLFQTTSADRSSNYARISSSAIDTLFAKGITTFDISERKSIYRDLQEAIQDEAFFYPIASNNYLVIFNNRVGGIEECGLIPIYTLNDPSYLTLN